MGLWMYLNVLVYKVKIDGEFLFRNWFNVTFLKILLELTCYHGVRILSDMITGLVRSLRGENLF